MDKKVKMVIILLLFLNISWGWNQHGHLLVVEVAKQQLALEQQQKLEGMMNMSLYDAAEWADSLKGYHVYAFSEWHYINTPYNPETIPVPYMEKQNLVWALKQTYSVIKNHHNEWAVSFMLRMLIHLIGDLHQPLHNIMLYNQDFPHGDLGGNKIKVTSNDLVGNKLVNNKLVSKKFHIHSSAVHGSLHEFWDSSGELYPKHFKSPLSDNDQQSIQDTAQDLLKSTTNFNTENIDFEAWSQDSFNLAVQYAYSEPFTSKDDNTLSPDYIQQTQTICQEQIVKAGLRLAHILQKV